MRKSRINIKELNSESLLAVPIKDEEIFELLERLAATEEMFKTPVSTIGDVAELTEASPNLIARLLGEMRGPGELEKIVGRLDEHTALLKEVAHKVRKLEEKSPEVPSEPRINRPNVVGSTVQTGRVRAPKIEEPPPQAWINNKRKAEVERYKEMQRQGEELGALFNRRMALIGLAIFTIWMIYAVLTPSVRP